GDSEDGGGQVPKDRAPRAVRPAAGRNDDVAEASAAVVRCRHGDRAHGRRADEPAENDQHWNDGALAERDKPCKGEKPRNSKRGENPVEPSPALAKKELRYIAPADDQRAHAAKHHVAEQPSRQGRILRGSSSCPIGSTSQSYDRLRATLTRALPRFSPFSIPMNARGAFARPSVTSSRQRRSPFATQ